MKFIPCSARAAGGQQHFFISLVLRASDLSSNPYLRQVLAVLRETARDYS